MLLLLPVVSFIVLSLASDIAYFFYCQFNTVLL